MKKILFFAFCLVLLITCEKIDDHEEQISLLLKATKGENAGICNVK